MYKESKIEKLTKQFFKTILTDKNVLYNHRPDWLRNPKTGHNLELDIYYPDLKFAVEVDGFTHEIDNYQKEKDRYKDTICKGLGIYLFRVKGKDNLLNKKYIKQLLKSLGIKYNFRLPYSLTKKIANYNKNKSGRMSKKYRKIKCIILRSNKTMKIYESYEVLQARETAGNIARMKNKKK